MKTWTGVIAVAVVAAGLDSPSSAKPPQLPVPSEVRCQKQASQREAPQCERCAPAGVEVRHPRGTVEFRAVIVGHPAGAVVTVDGSGAEWISRCWQSLCRVFEAEGQAAGSGAAVPAQQVDVHQGEVRCPAAARAACPVARPCCEDRCTAAEHRSDVQARREVRELYEQADQARRQGNWQHAYRLYEEIHLRLPNSRYGQVAKEWLTRIEEQGNGAAATAASEQIAERVRVIHEVARRQQEEAQRQARAAEMFQTAELCRRSGNFNAACERYREVIRIAPESDLADEARARLQRFQELRHDEHPDVFDEPEVPDSPLQTIPGPIGWIHVPAWPMPVIVPASCPPCPQSDATRSSQWMQPHIQWNRGGNLAPEGRQSEVQYERIHGGIGPE